MKREAYQAAKSALRRLVCVTSVEVYYGIATLALCFAAGALAQLSYPVTPKKPVTDIYHGVKVVDEYRWLENFDNAEVKKWAKAENSASRNFLDALPARAGIYSELQDLDAKRGATFGDIVDRGAIFALMADPHSQHPMLVALPSLRSKSAERVIVDPDRFDPKHLTAIDFYVPSLDGKYVAISLSGGGSESGDVHVYDVKTGKPLTDVVPRVNGGTAGGSVAWNAGSTGFWYTRYPRGKERPAEDLDFYQQVWFHQLGQPTEKDTYSTGKQFPRIAEILLKSSRDGRHIAASVAIGDGGDVEHWLSTDGGEWREIARASDSVREIAFGFHDDLFLLSHLGAPRGKVLRLLLDQPLPSARVAVPESQAVIEAIVPTSAGLAVADMLGGPSGLRFIPSGEGPAVDIPIPPISSVSGIARMDDGSLVYNVEGYLLPPTWYSFDPITRAVTETSLHVNAPFPVGNYETVREFAVSKDGTKVPLNIIRRQGIPLDGSHPTLLTGYGGYGINIRPHFSAATYILLERGFVMAEANLRGGGEFGEQWHDAGKLTRKQNVFDDFAACAHLLIDRKYTVSAKLGIIGGSNGGLLMGAELTQHPHLFKAVVSEVGIYDMLRVELSPNGAFNVTEFGTVKELDQFRAMYAYSPYHHVKNGVQYPAILFTTGDNDPRVDPMNSRKMTARLQAAGTGLPVLLRTSGNAGHGIGTAKSEAFAQVADIDAFLLRELK